MRRSITALCVGWASLSCSLDSRDATFNDTPEPRGSGRYELDPTYLKAEQPEEQAWFGYVLSARDGVVAASAPFETVNGARRAGALHLFESIGGEWTGTRRTLPNAEEGDGNLPQLFPHEVPPVNLWGAFGVRFTDDFMLMPMPADDSGDPTDPFDNGAPESGAVYLFDRKNLEADPEYLKAPHIGEKDLFGLATGQLGEWVMVGAPGEDSEPGAGLSDNSAVDSGVVFLFRRRDGRLVPEDFLKPAGLRKGDFFGSTMAVSGNVMAVGAPTQDATDAKGDELTGVGAVYVFRLVADRWTLESHLTREPPQAAGFFGSSLATSGDVLAVGANAWTRCNEAEEETGWRGAVFMATAKETDWSIDQCLSPRSLTHANVFGWRVAMLHGTLVVGAIGSANADDPEDKSKNLSGAVHVFQRDGSGMWIDTQYLKAPNPDGSDLFGYAVDLMPGVLAVGAPRESGRGTGPVPDQENGAFEAGAVYLFREIPAP